MELPEHIRQRLGGLTRTVFADHNRTQPSPQDDRAFLRKDDAVVSSLPLQMSLYFNLWFFPAWWVCEVVMLQLKYPALPDYYKFILVTVLIMMTLIEGIRLYLGYIGNLQEKVPELAGFWLLSLLLQFPLILFQLFNESMLVQPLERGVHIVLSLFILTEGPPVGTNTQFENRLFFAFYWALAGFVALREMVRQTESHFHLQQFAGVQEPTED